MYFGPLIQRADSASSFLTDAGLTQQEEGRRRRGRQSMTRQDGVSNSTDMSLSKLWERVKDWES